MTTTEQLSRDHAALKAQLAELTDFINSEDFFALPDNEKSLVTTQRTGMEMALSAMSVRLWGGKTAAPFNPSMLGLLTLMMSSPTSSPSYSFPPFHQEEEKKEDID